MEIRRSKKKHRINGFMPLQYHTFAAKREKEEEPLGNFPCCSSINYRFLAHWPSSLRLILKPDTGHTEGNRGST
jgi:hypothetical protein